MAQARFSLDTPGDEGPEDAPLGNDGGELVSLSTPVQVSIYKAPSKPKAVAPVASAEPAASEPPAAAGAGAGEAVVAETGGAEGGPAGEATDYVAPTRTLREGVQGKPPRGKKKPCETIEEIVSLGDDKWRVERDLLDWYATHLRELEKQVAVSSHRGDDGKRDGARLYLPRCSLLKQGGFQNGDVVHTVNGRKLNTVAQGVAAYLAVRNDRSLTVELTRKDGTQRTQYYRLK